MKTIDVYTDYFASRKGKTAYILRGGRRSGKTIAIMQRLILLCEKHRRIVNVASMTKEQGRLGAYADAVTILRGEKWMNGTYFIKQTPREIVFFNGSKIFFNSYQNSETAKGVACDYVFLNEANNFTEQQYIDLIANARRGVYLDFNPNIKFWVDKYYKEEDMLTTTWRNNPFLTRAQRAYFHKLKVLGTAPDATPVNVRNYLIYYCGQYSEVSGKIFFEKDFRFCETYKASSHLVFCDPSAMRGNDWFACVLSAWNREDETMVVVDTYSINEGQRADIIIRLKEWCKAYDIERIYIETNGIIGVEFFEFAQNSGLPVEGWYSRGNKHDRILAQYGNLTERTSILDTDRNRHYLEQVFDFDEKCEHDDNADALASSFVAQRFVNT